MRGGGVERIRLVLAREFLALGHEVDFVLVNAVGDLIEEIPGKARIFDLKAKRLLASTRPLILYLKRERPDAILVAMWPLTIIGVLARWLAGAGGRLLLSDHNNLSRAYAARGVLHRMLLMRPSMTAFYRMADARVAVSKGIVEDLASLSGLSPKKFRVVHNPVTFPPGTSIQDGETEALWRGGGPRLLSVGSLKPQKNHALLIDAFARLAIPDAKLMILGSGPLKEKLLGQADRLGVAAQVILPGFVAKTEPIYRSADLFVLTSDYEGFGNVLVEALHHGLPVVSTNCPSGPSEILADGEFGTLVPCGDVEALVRAIRASLGGIHDVGALKRRGAHFSAERAATEYLDALFGGE